MRPKLSNASASWLTKRQARKAGLAKTDGLFLGIADGQPLFLSDGVHGLICAPARKGKTTSFVMPAIIQDFGASKIVADMIGDLAAQTSELITTGPDQDVIILNPAHKFDLGNAAYNPMQIILDDLEHAKEDLISDAWSMAMQLVSQLAANSSSEGRLSGNFTLAKGRSGQSAAWRHAVLRTGETEYQRW